MVSDISKTKTYQIVCPECFDTWYSQSLTEHIARQVDAAMHWVDKHDGPIPDSAPFGNEQCPSCLDILGLNGTVSCSECGFIPEEVRLAP